MSESTTLTAAKPAALAFEQQLYLRSPFGIVVTTLIVLVVLFGAFVGVATLEHVTILDRFGRGFFFSNAAWPAVVLSLLCCTALGMQRYARAAEAKEAPDYAKILTGGMASAREITAATPRDLNLLRPTVVGLGIGLVISAIIRISETQEGHAIPPLTMAWYAATTTFMVVLFVRGVAQTRAGNRGYARTLEAELKIDLLRIDTLAVLGRSAARWALIWFVISAVACLFFIGGDLDWLTILLIVSCAAMGIILFVSVMVHIHRQIRAAKDRELEHARCQIDALRSTMHEDGAAASRLLGVLAYEKRIAEAPEWPFDQTTLVRVGASAFIVTVPWFGQAIAGYFVEHLTQR